MRRLPKTRRNLRSRARARNERTIELARRFDRDYFDGTRDTGYGGYVYDGRWIPVARDIIDHFHLEPGQRVLDVGCAKGFLVKDLMDVCPGLEVFGLDISRYAIRNAESVISKRLSIGNCEALPFPDASFDAVIAKDVIHNQEHSGCVRALQEIERVAPGRSFIQVDAFRNPEEKATFESWVLTARTCYEPDRWCDLFREAGYTGAYAWTIIQ